jgi:hypothetical protein
MYEIFVVVVVIVLTSSTDHGQAAIVKLLGLHQCKSIGIQVLGQTKRIKSYGTILERIEA